MRAELEDADGLVALGGGQRGTEGEADDDADRDAGAGEGVGGGGDPGGVDHGAGEAVFGGLVAELEDLGAGGVGLEQRVIEDGGEVSGEERVWAAKAALSHSGERLALRNAIREGRTWDAEGSTGGSWISLQ